MAEYEGVKDIDLYGKVALVSADQGCCGGLSILDGEVNDCTSFYIWSDVWSAAHFSYDYFRNDYSELSRFKAVILQAEPSYVARISEIARQLKGKTVTMFQPERVLGDCGINQFCVEEYEAWSAVDVILPWEEGTESFYMSFVSTPTVFVHLPITQRMSDGEFFQPILAKKNSNIVVYGDNNPTNPLTAIGCAKRLKRPITAVMMDETKLSIIKDMFGVEINQAFYKLGTYPYLRLLGGSWLHIYPNSRLGSNREPVTSACAGTPCIGNRNSHTQKRLWPKLCVDHRNIDEIVQVAEKLYNDTNFYQEVIDYAWKNVQFYNLENTKQRFLKAYVEGRKKSGC